MEKDLRGRAWMSEKELDRAATRARVFPYVFVGTYFLYSTVVIATIYQSGQGMKKWITIPCILIGSSLIAIFLWRGLRKRAKHIAVVVQDVKTNSRSVVTK